MSSSSSHRDRDNRSSHHRRDDRRSDHRRDDYESSSSRSRRDDRGDSSRRRAHSPSAYDAEYESRRFRDRRDRDKYSSSSRRSRSRDRSDRDRDRDRDQQRYSNNEERRRHNSYSDDSSSRDYENKNKRKQQPNPVPFIHTSKEAESQQQQQSQNNKSESEYLSKLSDEKLQESYDRYENDPSYDITDGLLDNIVIDKEKIHLEMQERLRQHLLSEGKVYPPPKPEPPLQTTAFANDGSFLDMFKKMQEQQQAEAGASTSTTLMQVASTATEVKKPLEAKPRPVGPMFGKRRGGKILKTGIVEKKKPVEDLSADAAPGDAWSQYMKEVKRYKAVSCDVDNKNRPLVK